MYKNVGDLQMIPEFDMPGHAHAAIAAMKARHHVTTDPTYLLNDLNDTSHYRSLRFTIISASLSI